jgi:hypothetical protein
MLVTNTNIAGISTKWILTTYGIAYCNFQSFAYCSHTGTPSQHNVRRCCVLQNITRNGVSQYGKLLQGQNSGFHQSSRWCGLTDLMLKLY